MVAAIVLDFYPYVADALFAFAPPASLQVMCSVSRSWHSRADAYCNVLTVPFFQKDNVAPRPTMNGMQSEREAFLTHVKGQMVDKPSPKPD